MDPYSSLDVSITKTSNSISDPLIRTENLINPVNFPWNEDLLKVYIHPDDVTIIPCIPVSRSSKPDMYGWNPTVTGRYTVKSGIKWKNHNRTCD